MCIINTHCAIFTNLYADTWEGAEGVHLIVEVSLEMRDMYMYIMELKQRHF